MENFGIFSILIPLLIIAIAIITKDVVLSLLFGALLGELLTHNYNPLEAITALLDDFVALFSEAWITKTILFALLVGAIIKLIERGGGVDGFISYIQTKQQKLDSRRGSLLLAYILGVVIFIESSITSLIAGAVSRPLCDKNGVSREKLALVCDSTSAPICSLIPFNGWGALLLGLILTAIEGGVISGDGTSLLVESILFNFYSIITVIFIFLVVWFDIEIGSMGKTVPKPFKGLDERYKKSSPLLMVLPITILV
ncbi:MAG: sodium:proton antiporter, partial [Epsilonproteobacteria bacterium]|nr:sodium:proton antiporter [Campylobacterota bacterium]